MLDARLFIKAMKQQGYAYDSKRRVLKKEGFNGASGVMALIKLRHHDNDPEHDYADIMVYNPTTKNSIILGEQDLVPLELVTQLLALIKAANNHWANVFAEPERTSMTFEKAIKAVVSSKPITYKQLMDRRKDEMADVNKFDAR